MQQIRTAFDLVGKARMLSMLLENFLGMFLCFALMLYTLDCRGIRFRGHAEATVPYRARGSAVHGGI